jgi:hypothetical protein
MKTRDQDQQKDYQKPAWKKQQLFERFTMSCEKTCTTTGRMTAKS